MELTTYFWSVLQQDRAAVVICNLQHEIIYMNPAAVQRYAKSGGAQLVGRSLLDCHPPAAKTAQCISDYTSVSYTPDF